MRPSNGEIRYAIEKDPQGYWHTHVTFESGAVIKDLISKRYSAGDAARDLAVAIQENQGEEVPIWNSSSVGPLLKDFEEAEAYRHKLSQADDIETYCPDCEANTCAVHDWREPED